MAIPTNSTVEPSRRDTSAEEFASAITHGMGSVLAIAGLVLLVLRSAETGDPFRIVGFTVFGASMVLLYLASTLCHALAHTRAATLLRIADHALIYFLIAGTYTPVLLLNLRGPWGWSFLGIVWTLALAGIVFKVLSACRFDRVSTALYLAMGWIGLFAAGPLLAKVPSSALAWFLAGGLAYTGGTFFYLCHRLKYHHAIWHAFVLAGTGCHFTAIYGHIG